MEPDVVAKSAKTRPTRVLPTERIAFPKQLDLLRAYGALGQGGAVALKDAAEMVKLNPTTATLANSFFVDNGLLQKSDGGRLVPGPDTIAYARAFQWNPESAARKLEPALTSGWFATTLIPPPSPMERNQKSRPSPYLQSRARPDLLTRLSCG